ncbi:hypothetical protein [Metabacillus sp. Hm71]|uniref:hypothetical protein n=1 Tax=Metabacillus sp. Hm71 TaxID=3450743 RepID=UPI003F432DA9
MKANVPGAYEDAAYEFTYTKLMVDVLNKKINRAESEGKNDYKKYLEGKLKIVLNEQMELRRYLKKHGIKVTELEEIDEHMVQYKIFVKGENGGYKEGHQLIWKAWLKMRLRNLLNDLLR